MATDAAKFRKFEDGLKLSIRGWEDDMFPLPSSGTHEAKNVLIYNGFRIKGHHSPDHQWDMSRLSMFPLTPARAKERSISLRV